MHRDAVAEVGAIDVLGGLVELVDRGSDAARQFGADDQRQQYDDREHDRNQQQNVFQAA